MGGFQHKSVGTGLTQAEYEQTDTGHQFASQATGMMLYSSSSTVNTSLAIGSTSAFLQVAGGIPAWTLTPIVADDSFIKVGTDGDSVILNRSTSLSADAELSNVIEGTSAHAGVAANSLIISNVTNDGDIMFLVSDGGNSKGLLKLKGSDGTVNIAADTYISDGAGIVVGYTAQETISAIDGDTDLVPEVQIMGTTAADASILLGAWSTTATHVAAPIVGLLKSGNASIGSHTIVTDDEVVGLINAYADDGVDYESVVASIQFEVDGSPSAGDTPGAILLRTTADGAQTPTTRVTISSAGLVTLSGALNIGSVAAAGSDVDKFLVLDGSGNVDYRSGADTFSDIKVAASASASGVVELATTAEVNTSTDTTRAIVPDILSASIYGQVVVALPIGTPTTVLTVADCLAYFHVPPKMNGMDLDYVHVEVQGDPSGTTIEIEVSKNGASTQMLSTNATIDIGEFGTDTAATAPVIKSDGTEAVATNDTVQVNCTQIGSGDAGTGAVVTLGFRIP
jgi:hypothetical protein